MTDMVGELADPSDPWQLATNGYDVDRFYTRSTDGRGHSELIHTKLTPSILGQMHGIIATKKVPAYRTIQDFVRDAILHRAKYVSDLIRDGELERVVDAEVMLAEIEKARALRADFKTLLTEAAAELNELIVLGKATDAYVLLEKLEHVADSWSVREEALQLLLLVDDGRKRCAVAWDRQRPQ